MNIVPLQSKPAQSVNIILGGQSCKIVLHQRSTGLFLDLYIDDTPVILSRLCHDRTKIIRHEYLGFAGDLFFVDTQGLNDPEYTLLGSRYLLAYVAEGEPI